MNKKVEMHGICGRPAEALKIKDKVHALLYSVPDTTLVTCWDIIDQTILKLQANLINDRCWSPALSVDDKVYLVNETTDKDNNRIAATAQLPFSVNGLAAKQLLMYTANEIFGKCIKSHGISFPLAIDYELSDGCNLVTLEYEPDNGTESAVISVPMKMKKEVE